MRSFAFSPSHMTGFFAIYKGSSAGAGITLEKGVKTSVEFLQKKEKRRKDKKNSKKQKISRFPEKKDKIYINNKLSPAPVSRHVLSSYRRLANLTCPLIIRHFSFFPVGFGFGTSAAGALSLSLALNKLLKTRLPYSECVRIASEADFACGCGIGGVKAESIGGFLFRASPSFKKIKKLRFSPSSCLLCAPLSPIPTKRIIKNKKISQKITRAGKKTIKHFSRFPTLENFAELSNLFSLQTRLAPKKTLFLLKKNPQMGLAQVGNTLFLIAKGKKELMQKKNLLKKYSRKILVSKLSSKGAHVL